MTEDQRDEWHALELASLISDLDDVSNRIAQELAFLEKEQLLAPLPGLIMRAYRAGRLNPLPVLPVGGVGAGAPAEAQPETN